MTQPLISQSSFCVRQRTSCRLQFCNNDESDQNKQGDKTSILVPVYAFAGCYVDCHLLSSVIMQGYDVVLVHEASEAIAAMKGNSHPDLVLLSYRLPGLAGSQASHTSIWLESHSQS